MNSDIADLLFEINKEILDKVEKTQYVTSITRDKDNLIVKRRFDEDIQIEMPLEIRGLDGIDGIDGKDGIDGLDGKKGDKGEKGDNGKDGKDGKDGVNGKDGKDGKDGKNGKNGKDGVDGKDGADVVDAQINNNGRLIITTNEKTIDAGLVRRISVGRTGGGGGEKEKGYTSTRPIVEDIGGITKGMTFKNVSNQEMWDLLLHGSSSPSFSYFVISGLTTREIGDTIQGNYLVQWLIQNTTLLEPDSISIYYDNMVELLASNLPNTSSHNIEIPAIRFNNPGTATFSIQAFNTSLTIFRRTFDVKFMHRVYVGESDIEEIDETHVKNLRLKPLKENINGEYDMLAGEYKWFCYPFSWGERTRFKDADTGFDVEMNDPDFVQVTNEFGVTTLYSCYRTFYKLGGAISVSIE